MKSLFLVLLFGLLAFTVAAIDAEDTQEEFDSDVESEDADPSTPQDEDDDKSIRGIVARVLFEGKGADEPLEYHAGESITTVVGIYNDVRNPTYEVLIIAAHVSRVGDYQHPIQNFSATRHSRYVAGGNTASFRYVFTPDVMLDPLDYNLAIRLYFKNSDGVSFVVTAFNSTITVLEPLGFDSQQLLSYLLLIGMVVGTAMLFPQVRRLATRRRRVAKGSGGAQASKSVVETDKFDSSYVSEEHLRFREAMLQRRSSGGSPKPSSPKRPSAAK